MLEFPKIEDTPAYTLPPPPAWVLSDPSTWPYWIWLALVALLFFFGLALRHLLRKPTLELPPAAPLSSDVMALRLLEELRPASQSLSTPELAARVTEVIRTYLHRQFGILARYRTTQEILAQRRDPSTPPPAPALRHFEDFLLETDALNYGQNTEASQSLIDRAMDTIRKSNEQLHVPVSA
jgi:hypothetical protein